MADVVGNKEIFNPDIFFKTTKASKDAMARQAAAHDLTIASMSPEFFRSKWCFEEIKGAARAGKPIIAVYWGEEYAVSLMKRWVGGDYAAPRTNVTAREHDAEITHTANDQSHRANARIHLTQQQFQDKLVAYLTDDEAAVKHSNDYKWCKQQIFKNGSYTEAIDKLREILDSEATTGF